MGNDFLPHLPSLDIRDGGLDLLLELYGKVLPKIKSYLTTNVCTLISTAILFRLTYI